MEAGAELADAQAALTLEVDGDGVACLTFDDPASRHNILTSAVLSLLDERLTELEEAARAGRIRALVIRSGKATGFIAGADVREIAAVSDPAEGTEGARRGQRVFVRLSALAVPSVAAVNGLCLGGGTELILACDRRLAAGRDETRIGLPEVRLGIIPGFGGTTRLPRLVGVRAATELITTGRPISARRAGRIGLVDEVVPLELLEHRAFELARSLAGQPRRPSPHASSARLRLENSAAGRRAVLWAAHRQVMQETHGQYPAPLVALETIERTLSLPFPRALEVEAQAVGKLVVTPVCKNLIHVFFLTESAKKTGPDAQPLPVERVGVVGAGVMGGGIAQLLAYRGVRARIKDIGVEPLSAALAHARRLFDGLLKRHRITRRDLAQAMERIEPTLDYAGFRTADLVIEAIVERLDVKKQVLREVEDRVGAECVLASNTSSLSITRMQDALQRPERLCGMHFFNPVHRMPLIEVVRGERTSDEALATVFALARRLDKTPIIVADGPGFLVNRLLAPYLNEAAWLLADGASIQQVDRALRDFGMPMGPFRLLDEVGLDIARHAGDTMYQAFGERMVPAPPLLAAEQSGRLGRKSGRGFYLYEDGQEKGVDPGIYAELRPTLGVDARPTPTQAILDRTLLVMVNEAERVLEQGIVSEPGQVDLGMITGAGFPPFRGGLLRYADSLGSAAVLERLEILQREHGARFEPAPRLRRLAEAGLGFYDADPALER
jgi:3-hydroxyacyl-CoA dehydrogenase / enoyl-CoA hydratase / 3-hydroxybutyryl-CoA epimerase